MRTTIDIRSWRNKILQYHALMKATGGNIEGTCFGGEKSQILYAQVICRFLDMTSDFTDHVTIALNICNLGASGCAAILYNSNMWPRLLSLSTQALQTWRNQPTSENRRNVEVLGAALGHLLLLCPGEGKSKELHDRFPAQLFASRNIRLSHLQYVLTSRFSSDIRCEDSEYCLKLVFLQVAVQRNHLYLWTGIGYLTRSPYDDDLLDLVARMISLQGAGSPSAPSWQPIPPETRSSSLTDPNSRYVGI